MGVKRRGVNTYLVLSYFGSGFLSNRIYVGESQEAVCVPGIEGPGAERVGGVSVVGASMGRSSGRSVRQVGD